MIVALLAWRDLWRDRAFLFGNVAVFVGMLTPLLVLYGVKSGVYQALIGELLADPAILQIDTVGNASLTPEDVAPVAGWPGVAFAVPRPRSRFDLVDLRAAAGGPIRDGVAVPSGAGDPTLPRGLELPPGTAVLSAPLAAQLGVAEGAAVEIVTRAEGRPRQLRLTATVVAVLDRGRSEGRTVYVPDATVDPIEAFHDGYALPAQGIHSGRPLTERGTRCAGFRVHADRLAARAPLELRLEQAFGVPTRSQARGSDEAAAGNRAAAVASKSAAVVCAGGADGSATPSRVARTTSRGWIERNDGMNPDRMEPADHPAPAARRSGRCTDGIPQEESADPLPKSAQDHGPRPRVGAGARSAPAAVPAQSAESTQRAGTLPPSAPARARGPTGLADGMRDRPFPAHDTGN